MPRDCPRCCLFVIVSFDENSDFGVYGELITPWKREIVLTIVSYGQLRISNVMAYGLQRFCGVFRSVAGYVDGKQVIQLPDQGWQGDAEHHQYGSDDESGEEKDDNSIIRGDRPEEERRDTPVDFEEGDDSDPDEDFDMDGELTQMVESIQLILRKSMQYCYRHHSRGLHTAKQDRVMYGQELDIQVEYIRQRGLKTKRIEAIVVDDPDIQSRENHVTETSAHHDGAPTGASNESAQQIPQSAFVHHISQGTRCDVPQSDGDDAALRPVTLKELDDPVLRRTMRRGRRLARNINYAIQQRMNATQRGFEGAENSTSMFTGSKARQLCEIIRETYERLPQDLPRETKEILVTEGISERIAYNKYGSIPWNAAEQD